MAGSSRRRKRSLRKADAGAFDWVWNLLVRLGRGIIRFVVKRRQGLSIVAIGLAMVVLSRMFLWPATIVPVQVDAVILFDELGDPPLDAALQMMELGIADILVLSHGTQPERPRANALCDGLNNVDYQVLCPAPTPENARGDARLVGLVAEANGWDSVVVVTSTPQVARAKVLVHDCTDAQIHVIGADPSTNWFNRLGRAGFEFVAYVLARVTTGPC